MRDFARGGFDYPYGSWKAEQLRSDSVGGVACVVIDAREDGGAGAVLGGVPIAPGGQRRLIVRLEPLAGDEAAALGITLALGGDRGSRSLAIDLRALPRDRFSEVSLALPDGDYRAVEQVQVQGAAWGAGARALKVAIASIATAAE